MHLPPLKQNNMICMPEVARLEIDVTSEFRGHGLRVVRGVYVLARGQGMDSCICNNSGRGGTCGRKVSSLNVMAANVTSLTAHWRSVSMSTSDFLLICESKANREEQKLIAQGAKGKGWQVSWGEPLQQDGSRGMKGRSGGTCIWFREPWKEDKDVRPLEGIGLRAPKQNWHHAVLRNERENQVILLVAYYGHPASKQDTVADFGALGAFLRELPFGSVLGGDFNISDDDPLALPCVHDLVDVGGLKEDMRPTHHSQHGSARIDKLYVPLDMHHVVDRYEIHSDLFLPNHEAISVSLNTTKKEQWIHVAAPPLEPRKHAQKEEMMRAENKASEAWGEVDLKGDLDEAYEKWSAIWERYLRVIWNLQSRGRASRGRVISPRKEVAGCTSPKTSLWVRRLSNFLNLVRRVLSGHNKGEVSDEDVWQKITRAALPLGERFGVPDFTQFEPTTPEGTMRAALEHILKHYQDILKEEMTRIKKEVKLKFQEKLTAHAGVNGLMSRLLTDHKGSATVRLQHEGRLIVEPYEVLCLVDKEWRKLFEHEEPLDLQKWSEENMHYAAQQPEFQLEPLLGRDLFATLQHKKKHTAPGQDSWRVRELLSLPSSAWDQLAAILNESEQRGVLPTAMTAVWMADLAKSVEPSPPLSIRPISITSVLYRVYVGTRTKQLQGWANHQFHPWQKAYIATRSPYADMINIATDMDRAFLAGNEGDFVAVLSLDASKAFPTTNRRLMWHILEHHGFPRTLRNTVESLYVRGEVRHRFAGKIVGPPPFRMKAGIHQGCSASVLGFNALLLPLCHRLQRVHHSIKAVIYADDITITAESEVMLHQAAREAETYLRSIGINLNPGKTQLWASKKLEEKVKLKGKEVPEAIAIKVLGMDLAPGTTQRLGIADHPMVVACKKAAAVMGGLPIPGSFKERAFAGVLLPGLLWQPWRSFVDDRSAAAARHLIIKATMPYLAAGARASAFVVLHLMKGHRVDPIMAPMWKLISYLKGMTESSREFVKVAFEKTLQVNSPGTALAYYLRHLGGTIHHEHWCLDCGLTAPLCPPEPGPDLEAQWGHQWRACLRHAILVRGTKHRREYQELCGEAIDEKKTLSLYRSLQSGKEKAALAIVLSGAMLTSMRTKKGASVEETTCPCGLGQDTEIHQYWDCERWSVSRLQIGELNLDEMPYVTRCTGIILENSSISEWKAGLMQKHMLRVAMGVTKDKKQGTQ